MKGLLMESMQVTLFLTPNSSAKMPVTPEQLEEAIRTKFEGGVEHVVSLIEYYGMYQLLTDFLHPFPANLRYLRSVIA